MIILIDIFDNISMSQILLPANSNISIIHSIVRNIIDNTSYSYMNVTRVLKLIIKLLSFSNEKKN